MSLPDLVSSASFPLAALQLSRTRGTRTAYEPAQHFADTLAPQPPLLAPQRATAVFTGRPLTPRYNVLPTPHCADARAIASDFFIAGNDMRAALSVWPYTIDFCRASRSA